MGERNADVGEEISDRGLQVRAVLSGSIGVVDPTRPVCAQGHCGNCVFAERIHGGRFGPDRHERDRKSTRLNSSHITISYAVFCLKKKKKKKKKTTNKK